MAHHEGKQEAPRYCEYRGASCLLGISGWVVSILQEISSLYNCGVGGAKLLHKLFLSMVSDGGEVRYNKTVPREA